MKIRIQISNECVRNPSKRLEFIDDVLFWGMETGMDISYYGTYTHDDGSNTPYYHRPVFAIFTVEEQSAFMFALKWGALMHKGKKERNK